MTSRVFYLCSLFTWVLWISSKQALTPFYGFDVKTKQCCAGHTERLLKLFWWKKRRHWPGFNSSLSNLASRFNFPKLPSLGWHLGWLVCLVLCVLQSNCFKCWILLSKMYSFYKMEHPILLLSDRIQFLGAMLVSVSCLEGHSLFNDVSSLLLLFSHLCIPSVWVQIPRETHIQGIHLDPASFMTAKYVWKWEIISGTPGLGEGKVWIWNGPFYSTGWKILIAVRKSLLVTLSTAVWISRCRSQAFLCHWINNND